MKRHLGLCLALLLLGWLVTPARPQDDKKFKLSKDEETLLELTNKARKKHDLKPLTPEPHLFEAARKHSANMAHQNKMAHILDGKTPFDRIKAAGYKYGYAGENVAYGNIPIEETFQGWMDSPPHRKNILSPNFTQIGLGRVENDEGIAYYTQVFGSPRP